MSELHFLRPAWFLALLPLALLLWMLAKRHLTNRRWESVCDPALLPYILVSGASGGRKGHIILTGVAFLLAIIALAGPTWERLPQPVFQVQSAVVLALDLSYSMYADDIKPTRLERARFEISDLLNLRQEGQTALLVYAGNAFTVTPLTDDTKTIKSQLTALSPEIMPVPGSNAGDAIDKAITLLRQAGHERGHILLITDEVNADDEGNFINAAAAGYPVSILAVGTDDGAPIRLKDGRFLTDANGAIVIPGLDQDLLRRLAAAGKGRYALSRVEDQDIEGFEQLFERDLRTDKTVGTEHNTRQWREFGPWLVLLLMPLAALIFRRGYLVILLCLTGLNPDTAMAFGWDDLWLNKDQQAMRALENKQADVAAGLFQDKNWRAAAQYRTGDFGAAADLLKQETDARSLYNRGNALARQGDYQGALAAYDQVLRDNPEHEDARFNKELLEKELQEQARQQAKSDQESQEESESGQSSGQQQSDQSAPQSEQQQAQATGQESAEGREEQKETGAVPEGDEQEQTDGEEQTTMQQQGEETESTDAQDEAQMATEQWLRRIPDDPGGLLRRKFRYQYQQQKQAPETDKYW